MSKKNDERTQPSNHQLEQPLGASEFAATLNGVNPRAILQVLKRFVATVQKERRIALELDPDEKANHSAIDQQLDASDNDEEIDPEDAQQPPTKKLKKSEEWKKDTNSYHVPFVGTAVARGDVAEVVKGQWPTGLLHQYLVKSPLAIELTGDDWIPSVTSQLHKSLLRQKQFKLSRAITKAYLQALVELVTATIPPSTLKMLYFMQKEDMSNPNTVSLDQFLPVLLHKRLASFFQLLTEETDKGRGKPGTDGDKGSVAPPILRFLQYVSMTSIANARLVCRFLHEDLPDRVLKSLLQPPSPSKRNNEETSDTQVATKPSRVEAIRLATLLLRTKDSAVLTYICSEGSRERKIKPGILYCAFREGLASRAENLNESTVEYLICVSEMIQEFRTLLDSNHRSSAIGPKLLGDLVATKDALNNLCALSFYAPPLTTGRSFQNVLSATDDGHEKEALPKAGAEARRLLFILLSDPKKSPLLRDLNSTHNNVQIIINLILRILQMPISGLEVRRFLIYSFETSPVLLPSLFRSLSVPEPKRTFDFLSTLSFVNTLMKNGPTPLSCLTKSFPDLKSAKPEDVLHAIFPSKLNRSSLGKALQSSNPLVCLECLKIVRTALLRFKLLCTEILGDTKCQETVSRWTSVFAQWMPDIQVLLAMRSKYIPLGNSRGNALLLQGLHQVLELYAKVLPSVVQSSSFDWMKLLPAIDSFGTLQPLVQRRLLLCLRTLLGTCQNTTNAYANSVQAILEIMLGTQDHMVYLYSREIAEHLIRLIVESRSTDKESLEYIGFEISWWLDSLSSETLHEFCALLMSISDDPIGVLSKALPTLGTQGKEFRMNFSILLVAALCNTTGSPAFSRTTIQVATRCLLLQQNPVPVAEFILAISETSETSTALRSKSGKTLVAYSSTLSNFDKADGSKRVSSLDELLRDTLPLSHPMRQLSHTLQAPTSTYVGRQLPSGDTVEQCRFALHLLLVSRDTTRHAAGCLQILRQKIPDLLWLTTKAKFLCIVQQLLGDVQKVVNPDNTSIDLLIASCPFLVWRGIDATPTLILLSNLEKESPLSSQTMRFSFLTLFLFGRMHSISDIAGIQLRYFKNSTIPTSLKTKATQFVLNLPCPDPFDALDLEQEIITTMFEFWWSLSDASLKDINDTLLVASQTHFGKLVLSVLRSNSLQSAQLTSLLALKPPNLVIDHVLQGTTKPNRNTDELCGDFLKALLECDSLRYVPPLLAKFSSTTFVESKLWLSGFLDGPISGLLNSRRASEFEASSWASVAKAVQARLISALSGELRSQNKSVLRLGRLVLEYFPVLVDLKEVANYVHRTISLVIENHQSLGTHVFPEVCALGSTLVHRNVSGTTMDSPTKNALNAALLCGQAELLLWVYKQPAFDSSTFLAITDSLLSLLENEIAFDQREFKNMKKTIWKKLCRAGLKQGIHDNSVETEIAAASLKLVGVVIQRCVAENSQLTHFTAPNPTEVFEMASSHSKFTAMVSREKTMERSDIDRIELFQLLHTCLKLSEETISLDDKWWSALFSAFNAGLDGADVAIRDLMYLASTKKDKLGYVPFLDETRWSRCEGTVSHESKRWDWLLDALETKRIRDTVARFPVHDTLYSFDKSIDRSRVEAPLDEIVEDVPVGEEPMDIDDGKASDDEDKIPPITQEKSLLGPILDTTTQNDTRYSPAFILTLVLGALDAAIVKANPESDGTEMTTYATYQFKSAFVPLAKGLIDKGVPALCCASLASTCSLVRELAVSVLGLLSEACNSSDARAMTLWRDRPQMAMFLHAVQRGLVLYRASQLSDGNITIPVMSSLVTTFLARASLSIARPDDALYVPLNRYFLKSDADHGAFQDMNRLPGFISLYCSAADDALQARKERLWALHLIKEGFLDESCYRLVASCHAPELLLTSLLNLHLSPFSNEMKSAEICLILDSIKAFLDNGGYRAASHLLGRLGLLSWIRSFCESDSLGKLLPSTKSRLAMYGLIGSAVEATSRNKRLQTHVLIQEICCLSGQIVEIAVNEAQNDSELIAVAVNTMHSMVSALEILGKSLSTELPEKHPGGITENCALTFLQAVPSTILQEALASICKLPVRWIQDAPMRPRADLCSYLLDWCGQNGQKGIDLIQCIIRRVQFILNHVNGDLSWNDANERVARTLLSFRSIFIQTEEGFQSWAECLDLVRRNLPDEAIEGKLAANLLKCVED